MVLCTAVLCMGAVIQAADTYTNPVISEIGPADPAVLFHEGIYYLYPTGDNTSYHVYTSYDLVHWAKGPEIFRPGGINVWAPDVFFHEAGGLFYLYYTADFKIGVATANRPEGPFTDQGILLNGFIDAHLFEDEDGKLYLYFTDIGHIYVQEMDSPTQLKGTRQGILQPSQSWEMQWGSVNEGPWMLKQDGVYYLLYSGSGADSQYYAVGYATASSPLGPFTKYAGNPIVHRGGGVYGPGHGAVVPDAAGNLWHIYHQKTGPEVDWNRFLCLDPMRFDDNGILRGMATRGVPRPGPVTEEHAGVVAWWRFEDGTPGTNIVHPADNGVFSPDVMDVSGNGNHLSAWTSADFAGYRYQDAVAGSTIPRTGAANTLSVKNAGGVPGMFTQTGSFISTMTPLAFTVEVTCKLENGGYRTIIGRDSYGTAINGDDTNPELAAFYLQAIPNNGLAVKFCDVAGYWHDAISANNIFQSFDFATNPEGDGIPWYSIAAVSDGLWLKLYLYNHDHPEDGYVLIAQNDLINDNPGSTNTALSAGAGDGGDWDAGNWSVGRGLYNGDHTDRAWGYIDEVRISRVALAPSDFLFSKSMESPTLAYWRFEEGPADSTVPHGGAGNGAFYPGTADSSGSGNDLSAWSESLGAFYYRSEVASPAVPQSGADNHFSLQNADGLPGLFTSSAEAVFVGTDIETWTPAVFTIEASLKPESGGHRTIVGRDGINVASSNGDLAALYFQIQPDDSVAIKFADVSGYWHTAVSDPGVIQYEGTGHWYHMAAVCDGDRLRLYLDEVDAGLGYQLVAETDLSASGSPDRRLVADSSAGNDWHGGGWSVGRGLYEGEHTDRFYGLMDEVRISSAALDPTEFLFYQARYAGLVSSPPSPAVSEEGPTGVDVFFSLQNPPAGEVVLTIQEQNGRGQVTLDRTTLTFTTGTWNLPQPIHVTAVDDEDLENAEHPVPLSITVFSPQDQDYDGLDVEPVLVLVADNECGAWGYARGDFNIDCLVDLSDLVKFTEGWLASSDPDEANSTNFAD